MLIPNMKGLGDFFDFVDFASDVDPSYFDTSAFDFGGDFSSAFDVPDYGYDYSYDVPDYSYDDYADDYGGGGGGDTYEYEYPEQPDTYEYEYPEADSAGDEYGDTSRGSQSGDSSDDNGDTERGGKSNDDETAKAGTTSDSEHGYPRVPNGSGGGSYPRTSTNPAGLSPAQLRQLFDTFGRSIYEMYTRGDTAGIQREINSRYPPGTLQPTVPFRIPGTTAGGGSALNRAIDSVKKQVQANPWIIPALAIGGGMLLLKGKNHASRTKRGRRNRKNRKYRAQ